MTNYKQQQLADDFFQSVKSKFPEVELINVTSSPEDPRDLWINVTTPKNEDREFELMDLASEKSADILMEYGYSILLIPSRN